MGSSDSRESSRSGLGGFHHLPFYSMLCASPKAHIQMAFCLGSLEIVKVRTFVILGAHNFLYKPLIDMRYKAKL
jgi:hypothetical protein